MDEDDLNCTALGQQMVLGSDKYNSNIMDDPVLRFSGQELSMSSTYPHEGTRLETLLILIWTQNFDGVLNKITYDPDLKLSS